MYTHVLLLIILVYDMLKRNLFCSSTATLPPVLITSLHTFYHMMCYPLFGASHVTYKTFCFLILIITSTG